MISGRGRCREYRFDGRSRRYDASSIRRMADRIGRGRSDRAAGIGENLPPAIKTYSKLLDHQGEAAGRSRMITRSSRNTGISTRLRFGS